MKRNARDATGSSCGQRTTQGACVYNRAVQDCGRRLNQSHFRPMAEVSFLPSANTRKRASASRELLRKKDSKSRTKINSSPGLIRAYVRTYGRTRATTKFSCLDGFTNFYGYGAPPAGAFGARGSSANILMIFQK